MMMNKFKLLFVAALICTNVFAQQLHFSGVITFERKENLHKQFVGNSAWQLALKEKMPKYRVDEFTLTFNKQASVYQISKEEANVLANRRKVAANNLVVQNFDEQKTSNIKEVYDEVFIIEDSILAYQWKYHGEYRKIAGFNCRKVSTIINDSLYIIAYYTDEIPVSGGPESFTGLPGMILGFVAPRLSITCFATNVLNKTIAANDLAIKKPKGKLINNSNFLKKILSATDDWGEYASNIYFKVML